MLVAYCRPCHHCRNLAKEGCLLSRFHFTHCHYFLGHVAFWNLLWQGLIIRMKKVIIEEKNNTLTFYQILYTIISGKCMEIIMWYFKA